MSASFLKLLMSFLPIPLFFFFTQLGPQATQIPKIRTRHEEYILCLCQTCCSTFAPASSPPQRRYWMRSAFFRLWKAFSSLAWAATHHHHHIELPPCLFYPCWSCSFHHLCWYSLCYLGWLCSSAYCQMSRWHYGPALEVDRQLLQQPFRRWPLFPVSPFEPTSPGTSFSCKPRRFSHQDYLSRPPPSKAE